MFQNSISDDDWAYFIEIYPWNLDDVGEKFVKLMRFAPFTRLTMKKKPNIPEEPAIDTEEKTDSDVKKTDANTKPAQNRERVGLVVVLGIVYRY